MARPSAERDRPSGGQRALTLVEVLVAVALFGALALGAFELLSGAERGRRALAAKTSAETTAEQLLGKVQQVFRTRMRSLDSGGATVATCATPAPAGNCLVLSRRQRVGGIDVVERFVVKNVCRKLTVREAFAAGKFHFSGNEIGQSTRDLCGHVCPVGQRPLVLVRHFPNDRSPLFRDELWPPADQLADAAAVSAGICMRRTADEVHVLIGTTFARQYGGDWRLLSVKKDAVLPLAEDASRIEWVP